MAEYRYYGEGGTSILNNSTATQIKTRLELMLVARGLQAYSVVVTKQPDGIGYGDTYSFNLSVIPILPSLERNAEVTTAVKAAVNAVLNNATLTLSGTYGQVNTQTTQPTTNNSNSSSVNIYTVKSGDTLSKIASRYNTTWQALARLNNLTGNQVNQLKIGQVLNVSGTPNANIPVIDVAQVNQVLNQNQQNTNNQTPYIAPTDNSKKPSQIEDFATKLGLSVGMLAAVSLVLLVVITKKK